LMLVEPIISPGCSEDLFGSVDNPLNNQTEGWLMILRGS